MTGEEYIDRIRKIGYDVHCNNGIWWLKTAPFFYEPAIPYQQLEYGNARPKFYKAILGYRYVLRNSHYANKYREILMLREPELRNFNIKSLSSSKRAQVRKGLRLCKVKKIEVIEPLIKEIQAVSISQAERTRHGTPSEYYKKHYDEWSKSLIKQSNIYGDGKETWGAFFNGKLIAFINVYYIDTIMIVSNVSSHTEHLDKCSVDALIFTVLEKCRDNRNCREVTYGDWSHDRPSLNSYKQKYGFEKVDLPIYVRHSILVPLAKKIREMRKSS